MNKILLFLVICTCTLNTLADSTNWHPTQIWNTNFTFNGTDDQVSRMVIYNNNVFAGGWHDNTTTLGGVGSFNLLTGTNNWVKVGTNAATLNGDQFAVLTNRVAYTESGNGGNFLIIRDLASGNVIVNEPRVRMDILGYGDSLIGTTREGSAKLVVMNSMGVVCRQMSLGYNLAQGMVTVRRTGNNVWIIALFFQSGGYHTFVEKRDLLTGALVWRHQIMKALRCYGDVDERGNTYVGVNIDSGSGKPYQFFMQKLDSNRVSQWEKMWLPNNYGAGENTVGGMAVSQKGDIVTIVGTQRVLASTKYAGYVYARNVSNGDSVFVLSIQNNPNISIGLRDVAFDTTGSFIVLGQEYTTPNRTLFLRKYQKDSLVGIQNPPMIAQDFRLSQNYPNPFNPSTKIRFSIPSNSFIQLKIFDALGRVKEVPVNGNLQPSEYVITIETSNYSSGVYFYQLISDNQIIDTKKFVVLK